MVRSVYICMVILCFGANAGAQEDLTVFAGWKQFSNAGQSLYNEISRDAFHSLAERSRKLTVLDTKDQWFAYRASVRGKLADAFGPMPEKTPLNARQTGVSEHEGITVEKIIYESRPGFWGTGCIFKRSGSSGKLPVVLYVCGHTADGYKSEGYQHVILNLARKGFLVFAIDPVGQGERLLYFDEQTGKSKIGGSTSEHSYAGVQYLPLGRTIAMVRLWDGIRAIDYLCSRPDVDPERIGVQGRSGGGTMSSYLGAMDDRITAAAPECYITSFHRLFQSIGPQDGEQNLLAQISSGLDHGDFLIARAPLPTLVVTTTRDFFSIQGARETVAEVTPAFARLGSAANIGIVSDDAPHMSTKANREKVYAFFMKAFGITGDPKDEDIPPLAPEQLQVTTTGQATTSGSTILYEHVRKDADVVLGDLAQTRKKSGYRARIRTASSELSGLRMPNTAPDPIFAGRFRRDGYSIEKVILNDADEIPIPALIFVPEGGGTFPAVLYLDDRGKIAEADSTGFIEKLIKNGYIVMAPDLPGIGELTGDARGDDSVINGVNYNLIFGAQLVGRSVTGIQAGAVLRAVRYLRSRDDVVAGGIQAISRGITGPALLHAAVQGNSLSSVAFIASPVSWESMLMHRYYDLGIGSTIVPSALLSYDLPDLMGLLAPRRILLLDVIGGDAKPASKTLTEQIIQIVGPAYERHSGSFTLRQSGSGRTTGEIVSRWLDER